MISSTDAIITIVGVPPDGVSFGAPFHFYWDRNKLVGCSNYGNSNKTVNTTANFLYDFWIRHTASDTISIVWGAVDSPSSITTHTAIETSSLTWNFIFTKL